MAPKKDPFPPQHVEHQPAGRDEMRPVPEVESEGYRPAGKLEGKVALVTGGDSGIGRSVAIHFALEGADVAVVYLNEHEDAASVKRRIEEIGRRCLTLSGDVGNEGFCRDAVARTVEELGRVDVLVNNAAEQHYAEDIEEITAEQLERTFRTNIFGYFFFAKAALPHLHSGSSIINVASVTAYKGNPKLMDYASTKGAIVAFTRSLSLQLEERKIRVNAVAPGPVWTPLIPASFPAEDVATFGQDYPMGRAAQPYEIAPTFVFLASDDASYYSGQVFHPNGGKIVGS